MTREHEVVAEWTGWEGDGHEVLTVGWETGGWTADGVITALDPSGGGENGAHTGVHYVVRLDDRWRLRQFLLFRDSPEPDLWLGVDPSGHWGEVNGVVRPELDGCTAVDLACTPFTNTLPIRRHRIAVGDHADLLIARVDPETLEVRAERQRYSHLAPDRWRYEDESGYATELTYDESGLVLDYPGLFRRLR